MRWRRFVAVGDSFTEGLNDPYPDSASFRGWADLVAMRLAAEHRATSPSGLARTTSDGQGDAGQAADGFLYANLAIRGRRFAQIVDTQVPETLRMAPDLVSFGAGGNDVILREFDMDTLLERTEDTVATIKATHADVILFAWPDVTSRLPRRKMIMPRLQILNDETIKIAARHGAMLVDMWHDDEFRNPRLWSDDRLHLAPIGHRRVAALALNALGLEAQPSWLEPVEPPKRRSWCRARIDDALWARKYYLPWLKRRLTGRSTGDFVSAKRPTLSAVIEFANDTSGALSVQSRR